MDRMASKVALVVGGAKGIGLAVAQRLTADGATIIITGRAPDQVNAAVAQIGHGAHGIAAGAASP